MLAAKVRINGSDQLWVAGLQWEPDAQVVDTSRFSARLKSAVNGVVGLTEASLSDIKGMPSLAALVSLHAIDGINLFFERVTVERDDGVTTESYWAAITQDRSPVYGSDAIYDTEEEALADLQTKLQALGQKITLVVGASASEIAEHNRLTALTLFDFLAEKEAFSQLKVVSTWSKASTVSTKSMIAIGLILILTAITGIGYFLYEQNQAKELALSQVKKARTAFLREKNRVIGAPAFNEAYAVLTTIFDNYDWYVNAWQVRGFQCGMGGCTLRYRTLSGTLSDFSQATEIPIDQLVFDSQENGTINLGVPYQPALDPLDPQTEAGSFNQMMDFCQKARKGGVTCQIQPPTPLSFSGIEYINADQLFSFGQLKIEGSLGGLDFLKRELFADSQYKWIRISQFDVNVSGDNLNVVLEGSYVVR